MLSAGLRGSSSRFNVVESAVLRTSFVVDLLVLNSVRGIRSVSLILMQISPMKEPQKGQLGGFLGPWISSNYVLRFLSLSIFKSKMEFTFLNKELPANRENGCSRDLGLKYKQYGRRP